MKLFVKLLTFASIAMTGTAALADNSVVLEQNYTAYRNAYNELENAPSDSDTEYQEGVLHEALGVLKKACNSKCTRFSCGAGSKMGMACTKYCTFQGNCLKKFDKAITADTKFKSYWARKHINLDTNGVPMTPLPTANDEEGMDLGEDDSQPVAPVRKPSLTRQSNTRQLTRSASAPVLTQQGRTRSLTSSASRTSSYGMDDEDASFSKKPPLKRAKSAPSFAETPKRVSKLSRSANSSSLKSSSSADVEGTKDGEACVCSLKGLAPAPVATAQTTVVKANDNAPAPAPQQKAPTPVPAPVEVAQTPPAPVAAPAPTHAPAPAPTKTPCELAGEANGMSADDAAANGLC